jgi:hypothetical protein
MLPPVFVSHSAQRPRTPAAIYDMREAVERFAEADRMRRDAEQLSNEMKVGALELLSQALPPVADAAPEIPSPSLWQAPMPRGDVGRRRHSVAGSPSPRRTIGDHRRRRQTAPTVQHQPLAVPAPMAPGVIERWRRRGSMLSTSRARSLAAPPPPPVHAPVRRRPTTSHNAAAAAAVAIPRVDALLPPRPSTTAYGRRSAPHYSSRRVGEAVTWSSADFAEVSVSDDDNDAPEQIHGAEPAAAHYRQPQQLQQQQSRRGLERSSIVSDRASLPLHRTPAAPRMGSLRLRRAFC